MVDSAFSGRARPSARVDSWRCALLATVLALVAASSRAQPPTKQVLLLQSFNRGVLAVDHFTNAFRDHLEHGAGQPVNVVQVTVGPTGFVGPPEQAVIDYARSIFAGRPPPDLIVSIAGPAAQFARNHRQQLFPEVPLLLSSMDQRWLRDAPLGENETAVAVDQDFPHLVDDILQLRPETEMVFMVVGTGPIGRFWRRQLEGEFARFRDRVRFVWSDDLSLPEVVRRCASLPPRSAILYLNFGSDARGTAYPDERVLAELHATANAPLFGVHTTQIGYGPVGGTVVPIEDVARRAAEVAIRILNGERPESLRVPAVKATRAVFDWRELQRWRIPESRLPPGSVVMHRPPSLWSAYRLEVLTAVAALVLQSLLITALMLERRARQRAETESRRNLGLAADANRRETMSALTNSIGHELAQPLSALMHNTRALQMLVARSPGTPAEMREILADIEDDTSLAARIIDRHRAMLRSRELEKKPIDLAGVIGESLALVAHELRARDIEATIEQPSAPGVVDGDPVLLQQVFVNLIRNAMDAVSEVSPRDRNITISSIVTAEHVRVSVADNGPGLPTAVREQLFTPFVTTKSNGLGIGLTIARTIVEAHHGTIEASGTPATGGGATFVVTLPRSGRSR